MSTAETATKNWLTRAEAMALLECTSKSFTEIIRRGLITRRDVPDHRRYWREDVERLASPPDAA